MLTKITLEIDFVKIINEAVKEEIKKYIYDNVEIVNVSQQDTQDISISYNIKQSDSTSQDTTPDQFDDTTTEAKDTIEDSQDTVQNTKYEYGPVPGRRRTKKIMALHAAELRLGRALTDQEKNEINNKNTLEDLPPHIKTFPVDSQETDTTFTLEEKVSILDEIEKESEPNDIDDLFDSFSTFGMSTDGTKQGVPKAEEPTNLDDLFT